MSRKIVGAEIRFGLHDASDTLAACGDMHQVLTQEIMGHFDRIAVVKLAWELRQHARTGQRKASSFE
jgi:hypothetical protein